MHNFSVTIPRFYKGVNVNCFLKFPSFLTLVGLALNVLKGCMIFLSPFLDVVKMSNVNCFFHRTARHWNSLPAEFFPLTFDLNDFKPRVNRHFELCLFSFSNHLFHMFFMISLPILIMLVFRNIFNGRQYYVNARLTHAPFPAL